MERRIIECMPLSPFYRRFCVYIHPHFIDCVVTNRQDVVHDWVLDILQYPFNVVGVSAQWGPFSYDGADTLELCIGNRCLIFNLRNSFGLAPNNILRDFLHVPDFTYVGLLWSEFHTYQINNIHHYYLGFRQGMPIDFPYMRDWRGNPIPRRIEDIARALGLFDIEWDAEVASADWDNLLLTHNQVYQACLTAFVSFRLGFLLSHGVLPFNPGPITFAMYH